MRGLLFGDDLPPVLAESPLPVVAYGTDGTGFEVLEWRVTRSRGQYEVTAYGDAGPSFVQGPERVRVDLVLAVSELQALARPGMVSLGALQLDEELNGWRLRATVLVQDCVCEYDVLRAGMTVRLGGEAVGLLWEPVLQPLPPPEPGTRGLSWD